jgi:hypothetical protein
MADSLSNLGEPILDRTLVLSVLRGLNEKFAYMGTILKRQKSFPSFVEVKNDLMVKEISMAKPTEPSHALIATALRPPTVGSVPSSPVPMQPPVPSAGPKKKNKNKKNSTTTWPSFYNLWTCLIQMWPGVPHGPLLGSCPPSPQQQQYHWPAPAPQHSPPPPQQAFLRGPAGPIFGGPVAHGGMLSVLPVFLAGPTLPGVPGSVGFDGPLPGPPLWLPS